MRSPERNGPALVQLLRNADKDQGSFSLSALPFWLMGFYPHACHSVSPTGYCTPQASYLLSRQEEEGKATGHESCLHPCASGKGNVPTSPETRGKRVLSALFQPALNHLAALHSKNGKSGSLLSSLYSGKRRGKRVLWMALWLLIPSVWHGATLFMR